MKNVGTGVLLMAYGAAANLEEIPIYLQDIRGGRPASQELIDLVKERYRLMGGKSPLLDITRAQAMALEARLKSDGLNAKVYIGMRHSPPTIHKAVEAIQRDGHQHVVVFPLTPYRSNLSTGAYFQKYDEATKAIGGGWKTVRIESWCRQPAFIEAWARNVRNGIERFKAEPCLALFTAHSLPERILKDQDPYPLELHETVQAVARSAGLHAWEFAYQS